MDLNGPMHFCGDEGHPKPREHGFFYVFSMGLVDPDLAHLKKATIHIGIS